MPGPQYTKCVKASDFEPINETWVKILGGVGIVAFLSSILAGGPVAWLGAWAIVEALRYALDWMLNKKLICLHKDPLSGVVYEDEQVCAFGEVGSIENVGEDKNPIEDVDNDYSINLILAPVDLAWHLEFAKNETKCSNYDLITDINRGFIQGNLIMPQNGMPPRKKGTDYCGKYHDIRYGGYGKDFVMLWLSHEYYAWTEIVGHSGDTDEHNEKWTEFLLEKGWLNPQKYNVPMLHCEFEGSRIKDVLNAINVFSFGGEWCKKNWFYKTICRLLAALFAPAALANALRAWASASGGSQEDARIGGEVHLKDKVIVRGRWVYDGGHSGYNELHAVRILQKIENIPLIDPKLDPKKDEKFLNKQIEQLKKAKEDWCNSISEVPPYDDVFPGGEGGPPWIPPKKPPTVVSPTSLSERQQKVYDSQQRPENQWYLHPALDGCNPPEEPPIVK